MTISGVGTGALPVTPAVPADSSKIKQGRGADNDAQGAPSAAEGHRRHQHGGGQFMQAVRQAFSQLDIGPASGAPFGPPPAKGRDDGKKPTGDEGSPDGQNIAQDMHKVMHDLFSALHQLQNQPAATDSSNAGTQDNDKRGLGAAARKAGSYESLSGGLQTLIQQLDSGAPPENSPLATLQTDFQALLTDAQGKRPDKAGSNSPPQNTPPVDNTGTLQTFLQNILNNLGGSTPAAAAVGGIITTTG